MLSILPVAAASSAPNCGATLQSLIDAAPTGSVLKVPACVYRETVTISRALTLDGQGNAEIRGSDVWPTWTSSVSGWVSTAAVTAFSTQNQGFCADGSQRCNWPEQVFVDGKPLTELAIGSLPIAGQFALDAARHIVLHDNPASHSVEVSTRERWVDTQADNVTIQGFTFRHAANAAETGALGNQNRNAWTLKDSQLFSAHGGIVSLGGASNAGTQTRVLRNTIAGSGYEGINGYRNTNTLIQGNTIYNNNLSGFDSVNWAGAGVKVVAFVNLVIDDNTVYGNAGPGLWCDIGCQNVTFSNNHVYDNQGSGIVFEISSGGKITGNSVWNTPGDVPAIYVSSSANTEVASNTVAGSNRGIQVYEANRSDRPASGTINVIVHDNSVVGPFDGTLSMVFGDDVGGHVVATSSGNIGRANAFWYPVGEGGLARYQWGDQQYSTLAPFAATLGGTNNWYLSISARARILSSAGIPLG